MNVTVSNKKTKWASKRRSIGQSKSVSARSMVPRYNAVNRISRWSSGSVFITTGGDIFRIQSDTTAYKPDFGFKFSPTGFTIVLHKVSDDSVTNVFKAWPGNTDWASLYEEVKIDKVVVNMGYVANEIEGSTLQLGTRGTAPKLYVASDINDLEGMSLAQTKQQAGCKCIYLGQDKNHKFTVRPRYQQLISFTDAVSSSTSRIGYVPSEENIPHYGVRCSYEPTFLSTTAGTVNGAITFDVQVFFSLKNVK